MKVLVAASSRHGATDAIAEEIGRTLAEHGLDVQVTPLSDVSDVGGFDVFVVGSAVYAGRWLAPARAFVDEHRAELRSRPTWLFSSGPLGDPPKPDPDAAVKIDGLVQGDRCAGAPSLQRSARPQPPRARGAGDRPRRGSARRRLPRLGRRPQMGGHDRRGAPERAGAAVAPLSGPSTDRRTHRRFASRRPIRRAGSAARSRPCRRSRSEAPSDSQAGGSAASGATSPSRRPSRLGA